MLPLSHHEPPRTPGQLLRLVREQAMLTQVEVARRAGIARSVVSRLESEERSPRWSLVQRVLAAFELQPILQTEVLDAHLLRQLDDERARPPMAWFDEDLAFHARSLVALALELPFVIDGTVAARMRGIVLPIDDIELALARTPTVEADLDQACNRQYAWLRPGPDDDTWLAPRADHTFVFRIVDQLPPSSPMLPPSTETYPSPAPQRTIQVAELPYLRLTADERRLLRHALQAIANGA